MNRRETPPKARPDPLRLLNALPQPLLALDAAGAIVEVNTAAETFLRDRARGAAALDSRSDLLPFGSPVFALIADALASQSTVNGYRLDISTPRSRPGAPRRRLRRAAAGLEGVTVLLQERSIAEKMDRQLTHRGAARSVSALGVDAGARDQEPAVRHPRRRATAREPRSATRTAR